MTQLLICLLTLLFSMSSPAMGANGGFCRSSFVAKGGLMNPNAIRFSQDSIRAGFKDPAFGTIDDLAAGLKGGSIKPGSIEPIPRPFERSA